MLPFIFANVIYLPNRATNADRQPIPTDDAQQSLTIILADF